MAFLKPQNPMTKGSDYFYPLTTADQVIMDGGYRLDEIVGKTKKSTIMLYANGWSAEVPYCYSVAVQGLSDKVNMKMLPHFPEDFEGKQAMKEETAKISFATREGNILTFECWDEVPTMDLPIDIEIEAMYPIKGASIEMNYSVVGGVEEPAEPAENMIWVNTDQDITNWIFSRNEPKNPEEGMIWFTTGDNSNVSFFTLRMDKREFDEIYPISAKQYVSSAWINVEVKSYQSEEWVDWITHLYKDGVDYEDITGSWEVKNVPFYSNTTGTTPSFSMSNSSMNISLTSSSGGGKSGAIATKKKIRLDNFKKIYMKFSVNDTLDGSVALSIASAVSSPIHTNAAAFAKLSPGDTMAEVDITEITGEYYIIISVTPYNGSSANLSVFEIYLL